jgi:hypothetical protein
MLAGQKGPEARPTSTRPSLAVVGSSQIGHLEMRNGELLLVFGGAAYHPQTDLERLLADGRIAHLPGENGREARYLYLDEKQATPVLLGEYLTAFQALGGQGIRVAFAERMDK